MRSEQVAHGAGSRLSHRATHEGCVVADGASGPGIVLRSRAAGIARAATIVLLFGCVNVAASNPLSVLTETFSNWKDRLFGNAKDVTAAPAQGPIALQPAQPLRVRIGKKSPERDFPQGKSHYRILELPADAKFAAVRVRVAALGREHAFGHEVFKPYFYALGDDDQVIATSEVKPLHLDIRPFRSTRLLGCVALNLDKSHRFAIATSPAVVGKSYESEVRDAIKAPTQGGFYYATDAVKVRLPWAATGEVVLDVSPENEAGKGC